ncbi:MAG TPA: MFS transporter [Acidimicrobiia bacterium]
MKALQPILPPSPFSKMQLRLVGLMWVTGILSGYAVAQTVNTLPFSRVTFGLSEGQMGFVLGVARVGALGALGFSAYGDRRGRRGPFLVALVVLFTSTGITALTQTPLQYSLAQSSARLGATAAGVLAVVLLAETLDPSNRAYGISLYGAGASFGAGLALVALPAARLGPDAWRWLFASGVVGLAIVPFVARFVNESPAFRTPTQSRSVFSSLVSSSFWILGLVYFLSASFTAVVAAFSTERLISDVGMTPLGASAVLLTGGTLGGIGFLVGGRLADVWGRRPSASFALSLGLIGGLGLYHLTQPVLITVAVAIGAFGTFSAIGPLGAQRAELFSTDVRTSAGVWLNNLGVAGAVIGLGLGPLTIDRIGLAPTVTLLGVAMLGAALAVMLLPETRGRPIDVMAG